MQPICMGDERISILQVAALVDDMCAEQQNGDRPDGLGDETDHEQVGTGKQRT